MENFILADANGAADFVIEKEAFSGVKKIAGIVQNDLFLVSGKKSTLVEVEENPAVNRPCVFVATLGKSRILENLQSQNKINVQQLAGKNECYGWFFVNDLFGNGTKSPSLVIAGSDKRGTIYGLFKISKLMKVSPYVNWAKIMPPKSQTVQITDGDLEISAPPAVKYRGFFINDEWPAFGTWATRNFGGVNAKLYAGVFELLLRFKGNYLWPAMWASCFACDGPGLESAELADELGVVMGLSHHEPCLRHGEEYSHVRGKDSIYGDAWNFWTNKDGITRFWEDGLKRNGHLENVITIGMRGERDSTILQNATLKDNIDLLKDVIKTQHRLIKENVNANLAEVPRMLALYKEVEPFFYGDENTEGLKEWAELDDVILMLCDDNHGYLRTLPDEKMRAHPGGYGMYYHFDYHGDPVSYEWTNSTDITEVWEQMTTAYEYGIRDLWIVNVGDLGLQEFPLNFFMDLAFDYKDWGLNGSKIGKNVKESYTKNWVNFNFAHYLNEESRNLLCGVLNRYTKLSHNRRPEHLSAEIFSPCHFNETERLLRAWQKIESDLDKVCGNLSANCPDADFFKFLVTYNVLATANLHKIWLYTGLNHYFASRGLIIANQMAQKAEECMERDSVLAKDLDSAQNGMWYGFSHAKHIGFKHWNSEERQNPVLHKVLPNADPMLVCGIADKCDYTQGGDWTAKTLVLDMQKKGGVYAGDFYLACCGNGETAYQIEWNDKNILIEENAGGKICGALNAETSLKVFTVTCSAENAEKYLVSGNVPQICVTGPEGKPKIALNFAPPLYAVQNAEDFSAIHNCGEAKAMQIAGLGRDSDGIKFAPLTTDFSALAEQSRPYAEYTFSFAQNEENGVLQFYLLPTNPFISGQNLQLCYSVNGGAMQKCNILPEVYVVGHTEEWCEGVMNHVRIVQVNAALKNGENKVRFYASSPGLVLEKIVAAKSAGIIPSSYYGAQTELQKEQFFQLKAEINAEK